MRGVLSPRSPGRRERRSGGSGIGAGRADLAVFHEFAPPPSRRRAPVPPRARRRARAPRARRRGEPDLGRARPPASSTRSTSTSARLRRFARDDCRMVHRVDGPIGVYRGFDDGTDRRIVALNRALADATIFQSRYSLEMHPGARARAPRARRRSPTRVDPAIFHPPRHASRSTGPQAPRSSRRAGRTTRARAPTSSRWLDAQSRPRTASSSRSSAARRCGSSAPRSSRSRRVGAVAELLRAHDVFVAASRNDPCSNALLEALACGLPRSTSQRRPSRGRRRGRARVRRRRTSCRRARPARGRARGAAGGDPARTLAEVADRYLEVLRG